MNFVKLQTLLFVILICFNPVFSAPQKLTVHFFGSPSCGECVHIKEKLLFPIQKRFPGKFEVKNYDIDSDSGFLTLTRFEEYYKVPLSSPQALFLPDTFLTGAEDILKKAVPLIERYLADSTKWIPPELTAPETTLNETLKDRVRKFSFLSIMAAGLVDGVNPCAIATLIFLISFMATKKRSKPEILAIGLTFTATVFLTYLLLGIGAFKVLSSLKSYHAISNGVRWFAVILAGVIGIIQFYDAWKFSKSGKTADIKLQLPKQVKLQIHKIISDNLTGSRLIIGSIITGFLVTLLEAVCTGQVYLPTIVLMTRESDLRVTGWLYLIFYNFLFVVPLLLIVILAYHGLTWAQLSKATQKNMVIIKIALGTILVSLAVFLGVAG